ncbi:unnamed protein product [Orchesella dallaii]|uniref:Uncharacterized protein n=1 Tax=Orchesella dallaii TaxID=48710 RepID=A0ABP1S0B1_9HEXA
MAISFLASLTVLIFVQVNSSPMPQGWNAPPPGWVSPPAGWVSPPGWGAVAPATEGTVLASGETVLASGIASSAAASDHISLSVISNDTSDMGVGTYLAPYNDFVAGFGSITGDSDNAYVFSDDSYIDLNGQGETSQYITLQDVDNGTITTNPSSSAGSSMGTFVASSYAQITDGTGLGPAAGVGGGWKKEEQV